MVTLLLCYGYVMVAGSPGKVLSGRERAREEESEREREIERER